MSRPRPYAKPGQRYIAFSPDALTRALAHARAVQRVRPSIKIKAPEPSDAVVVQFRRRSK